MRSDAEWDRLEDEYWSDRFRVRGLMLAMSNRVDDAEQDVERALSVLRNAQSVLDKAQNRYIKALDTAVALAKVVGNDDPGEYSRVAIALEEAGL